MRERRGRVEREGWQNERGRLINDRGSLERNADESFSSVGDRHTETDTLPLSQWRAGVDGTTVCVQSLSITDTHILKPV